MAARAGRFSPDVPDQPREAPAALKLHVRAVVDGVVQSESDLGIKAGGAGGAVADCSASQAVI